MDSLRLTTELVTQLVESNKYKVDPAIEFKSRCIDDRYHNIDHPAPLAIPGADPGELALIFATARSYGFEINKVKVFEVLLSLLGGEKNLQMHTDTHKEGGALFTGCGHMAQIATSLSEYSLVQEDYDFIQLVFKDAKDHHRAKEAVLEGEHKKNAVLMVQGEWGVLPRHYLEVGGTRILVEVFEYHETLVNKRHRALAQALIEKNAVTLYKDCDSEYLFDALFDVGQNHLMETLKRLAKGLPIYEVTFDKEGMFEVESLGNV